MATLNSKVCVVTGASRGLGRGIALALGAEGATVYVTGRTRRGEAPPSGRNETIDDTADAVIARGGTGIAVPCDHTAPSEVEAVFERIAAERSRIDVVVNNAWGGYDAGWDPSTPTAYWDAPIEQFDVMIASGLRAQIITAQCAARAMAGEGSGLIVNTTAAIGPRYQGFLYYDVIKNASIRMTLGMAVELEPHGIAAVALAPGWVRTERLLDAFGVEGDGWKDIPVLANSESPEFSGRAAAALAADPEALALSGQCLEVGHLARKYAFNDIDGRQIAPFSEQYPDQY